MCVQLGSIISAYIYLDDDRPQYRRGNQNLVIINFLAIAIFLFTKAYYVWRNRQRDRAWNALSDEQKADYVKHTKLRGSRRLDFRFAH